MQQFKSLAKKNFLLWRRGFFSSFLEIVLPIVLFSLVAIIRDYVDIRQEGQQQFVGNNQTTLRLISDPDTSLNYTFEIMKQCSNKPVALVPKGESLVDSLEQKLLQVGYQIKKYKTESQVQQIVMDDDYGTSKNHPKFCFAVIFDQTGDNYTYTLRDQLSSGILNPHQKLTSDDPVNAHRLLEVIASGTIEISTIINSLIYEKQTNKTKEIITQMAPIYQQEFKVDPYYLFLGGSIGSIVLFPILLVFIRQVSLMIMEKEKKIKANMCIMGMRIRYYYLTWFIHYFLIYMVIFIVNSGIFVATVPSISYFMPFIVFFLFAILLVVQAFFVQLFFERTVYGVIFACLYFSSQCAVLAVVVEPQLSNVQRFQVASMIPHVALSLAFQTMLYADSKEIQLDFSLEVNFYTINTCIISLILNILFWTLLTLYLDKVVGGDWRRRKHPLFCCCKKKSQMEIQILEDSQVSAKSKEQPGEIIKIKNLYKNYEETEAVKDLNLTLEKNKIFVLLGHNGAGKTTTISMLTGVCEPTSGQISIFGENDFNVLRNIIGLCPQENPLYSDLTVQEHLQLFGSFKGLEGEQLSAEIRCLLKDVDIEDKRSQLTKNISGGQKRKLSVAISFTGESKVIVLDEPTSGMDAYSRRNIWEMLKNYKSNRIILMTSHLMDQADHLGDEIGIMADGKLAAHGDTLQLKRKYGLGYILTVLKERHGNSNEEMIECINKLIPGAHVLSNVSSQVKVRLPYAKIQIFPQLFKQLDRNRLKYEIKGYGIGSTTLEEVFLKINESHEEKLSASEEIDSVSSSQQTIQLPVQVSQQTSGCKIFFSQTWATIQKRMRISRRDCKSVLFQLILPALFLTIGLVLMTVPIFRTIEPEMLNYDMYLTEKNNVAIPISCANQTYLDSLEEALNRRYGDKFNKSYSLDAEAKDFDKNILFPIKKQDITLKGGVYFNPEILIPQLPPLPPVQPQTILPFTAIVNTRSPTSFITVQSLAFQTYINYKMNKTISINVINKPFSTNSINIKDSITDIVTSGFGVGIFSIALAFKFASIAYLLVKEKECGSKDLQIISGMRTGAYWLGNFIYDYITYCLVAAYAIGWCFALDIKTFIGSPQITQAFCLLTFLYGFSNIAFTYVATFVFHHPFQSMVGIYFFDLAFGGVVTVIMIILRVATGQQMEIVWFFKIIPAFAYGEGIINLGSKNLLQIFENKKLHIFDMKMTLGSIIYLIAFSFLFIIILILIEVITKHRKSPLFQEEKSQETQINVPLQVTNEKQRAIKADPIDHEIITKHLTKVFYPQKQNQLVAVNDLSFKIDKGEVFGLLGGNGAGKTTTFKMLTRQLLPSSGQIYFQGFDLHENLTTIRKSIGYCPQSNPLIDELSVKEQLQLYYEMKCLPSKRKDQIVSEKIRELDLEMYDNTLSKNLSGGNKRKLSVAIAMMGNPPIIFMDEPSTGMDPKAKRFMWRVISKISTEEKQSTIILTTHSMEEAEALSSRLVIMVEGNFRCIGTPQEIKMKYGRGFQIQIKIGKPKKQHIQKIKKQCSVHDQLVVKESLTDILEMMNVDKDIKIKFTEDGKGKHIVKKLEEGKRVTVDELIQFCFVEEKILEVVKLFNKKMGVTQIIEEFEAFACLKLYTKVSLGEIFNFISSRKKEMSILEYAINQSTVEQIFNKLIKQAKNELSEENLPSI